MRVLTVSAAKWGIQNAVYNLIEKSTESEVEHTHLTLPIHPTPENADRIEILRERILELFDSARLLYSLYAIHFFWLLAYRYISQNIDKYDIIWLHSPLLLPFLPSKADQKTVITIHGSLMLLDTESHKFPISIYYRLLRFVQRKSIQNRTGVRYTAVNKEICKDLKKINVPPENIRVIGNGVDISRFNPNITSNEIVDEEIQRDTTLVSVARFIELKRPLHLLEVFAETKKKTECDLHLVLAGEGPLQEQAEQFVSERGLTDSVTFLGVVKYSNMPQVYASGDVFVLASESEGKPLVLYEAMASGLPSIVADIPSCDFIADANCGIVVNFNDPDAAANDISEFLSSEYRIYGDNSREYAKQQLTWRARTKEYHHIFHKVVSENTE